MATPKNWPEPFPYLRAPLHDKSLSAAQLQALRTKPDSALGIPCLPASATATPCGSVRIQPIAESAPHPARGQRGLFAARDLAPGAFVLPYLGRVHAGSGAGTDPTSDYDLWVDRDADVAVDAARAGNEARFVNDFRGVRPRANAEFRAVWCERWGQLCVGVWVLAGREGSKTKVKGKEKARAAAKGPAGIKKGEEIVISYGKGFWDERQAEMEAEAETETKTEGVGHDQGDGEEGRQDVVGQEKKTS